MTSPSPAGGSAHPPRTLSPPVYIKKSSSPAIRNTIIIIVLLAAIYGAWEFYQKKKVQRAAENALIIEQNEQSKIEAAEKNAKLKEKGLVDKIQKKFSGKSQSQFLQETEELRGFYRNKLTEIKTTLQTKGMNDQARTVDQELNATKVTGQAFVDYILGNN